MGLRDSIKTIGNSVVEGGKYLVSEFITNKDMSKGILDFDKYQEYSGVLNSGMVEPKDIEDIQNRLISEKVIDKNLYQNYIKKATQKEVKRNEVDETVGQQVYDFRNLLSDDLKTNYQAGDKYQREVLTKAIDEMTSQYEMLARNVMETYETTKNPELLAKRNTYRPMYELSIKSATKRYADYINQGMSYNEAYKKMIETSKEDAKRISDIQWNVMNKAMRRDAGVKQDLQKANEAFSGKGNDGSLRNELGNVPKGLGHLGKALIDTIGLAGEAIGRGIEQAKHPLGMYDVLEDLNSLNIYRDSGPILDQWRTLKSRGYEMLDGLPTYGPALLQLAVGNKAAGALKLDALMSTLVGGGKLANGLTKTTKVGKFLSEGVQDFLWMDIAAQPMIGRPMNQQDFIDNWLFNIPVNAGLAAIFKTTKYLKALPEGVFTDNTITDNMLKVLSDKEIPVDDAAKIMFLEKKFQGGQNQDIVNDMSIIGDDIQTTTANINNPSLKKQLSVVTNSDSLDAELKQRWNDIQSKAIELNETYAKGKMGLKDILGAELFEKSIKSDGGNLGLKSGDDTNIGKETLKRVEMIQQVIDAQSSSLVKAKLAQASMINLFRAGLISGDDIKSMVDNIDDGYGKSLIQNLWFGDTKILDNFKGTDISKNNSNLQNLEDAYNQILSGIATNLEAKGKLIPGKTMMGNNVYLGDGKYFDILTRKEVDAKDVFSNRKPIVEYKNSRNTFEGFQLETSRAGMTDYSNNKKLYDLGVFIRRNIKDIQARGISDNKVIGDQIINIAQPMGLLDKKISNVLGFDKSGVKTEINKILQGLGIGIDGTISVRKALELKNTLEGLQNIGYNISQVTNKELNLFKLIHLKDYIFAMKASGLKPSEFQMFFEQLYKKDGDKYIFDIERFNIKPIDTAELNELTKQGDIDGVEIKSSQIITESNIREALIKDTVDEVDLGKKIEGYLGGVKETPLYLSLKNAIVGAIGHIEDIAPGMQEKFIKQYSKIIGGILGDWKSRFFLTNMFMKSSEEFKKSIIQSFIARGLSKDPEISNMILHNLSEELDNVKNITDYNGIRDMIDSMSLLKERFDTMGDDMKAALMHKINNVIKSQIEKYHPDNQRGLFLITNEKLKKNKLYEQVYSGELDISNVTETNLRDISRIMAHKTLTIFGIKNETIAKKVSGGLYSYINTFIKKIKSSVSETDGVIKLVTNNMNGVGFKDGIAYINIDLFSQLHILRMLNDPKLFFSSLTKHEMIHVAQNIGKEKIGLDYKQVLTKLKEQYKELESKLRFGDNYGDDMGLTMSDYFYYLPENIGETELIHGDIINKIKSLYDLGLYGKDSKKFTDGLIDIYKLYSGDMSKYNVMYIIKEVLAEGFTQADLFGKIGISKENFQKIGSLIEDSQKILDDIETVFDDIGNKYTRKKIKDIISIQLPSKNEIDYEDVAEQIRFNPSLGRIGNYFLGENFIKAKNLSIKDDAVTKYINLYDMLVKKYHELSTPKTISVDGIVNVINSSISGIGLSLGEVLKKILGNNQYGVDIKKVLVSIKTLKNFGDKTTTSKILDDIINNVPQTSIVYNDNTIVSHLLNTIVANILSTHGMYDDVYLKIINDSIRNDLFNLEISNLSKNEGPFLELFSNSLEYKRDILSIKKDIGKANMKDFMSSVGAYIMNKELYTDIAKQEEQLYGITEILKPLLIKQYDGLTEVEVLELITKEGGVSSIVSKIMDTMYDRIKESLELFKRDKKYIDTNPGEIAKGLEVNSMFLLEGIYKQGGFDNKKFLKYIKGNGHLESVLKQYGTKRTVINNMEQYLKKIGIQQAWKEGVINNPIRVTFKYGGTENIIELTREGKKQTKEFIKQILNLMADNTESDKVIFMSGEDIGTIKIVKGDSSFQISKFFDSPIGKYILDDLEISPTYKNIAEDSTKVKGPKGFNEFILKQQELRKSKGLAPLTPDEIKKLLSVKTGRESITEGIGREERKPSMEILDEIKQYYLNDGPIKDLAKWNIPNMNKLEVWSKSKMSNKSIVEKIDKLIGNKKWEPIEYINKVLESKVTSIADGKELEGFKLNGFKPAYILEIDGEKVGKGMSDMFVHDAKTLEQSQRRFLDKVYEEIEDGDIAEGLARDIKNGYNNSKLDFNNDMFEVKVRDGKETKYGRARRNKWNMEIDTQSLFKHPIGYKKPIADGNIKKQKSEIYKIPEVKNMIDEGSKAFKC